MRDDHDAQPRLVGKAAEEAFQRLDAAGRRADADNRKLIRIVRMGTPGREQAAVYPGQTHASLGGFVRLC